MTGHAFLVVGATSVAIIVFLGLAIYVISNAPRRLSGWLFSLLCLTIATIYLSSLFLVAKPDIAMPISSWLLRLKWVAITLAPSLYLQLVFFYFPRAWRKYQFWVMLLTYGLSTAIALMILFTNLFVAGPLYRPEPHIMGIMPGPLIPLEATFFVLQIIVGSLGLMASYRAALSPSFRYQTTYLLISIGLVFLGATIHWMMIFFADINTIPHELPDALLILAAFLFARAVVRHGSFVGYALPRRTLFYSILALAVGLTGLHLGLMVDQYLLDYIVWPMPIATSMFVLILVVGFSSIRHWITRQLDSRLFRAEQRQRALAYHLAQLLAEAPNFQQQCDELLRAFCAILNTPTGYVALASSNLPAELLTVQAVQGYLSLQPGGDLVRRPPLPCGDKQPQLASILWPRSTEPEWENIAIFYPLNLNQNMPGVLAVGEKRDGKPFYPEELLLGAELIEHLEHIECMTGAWQQRQRYQEETKLPDPVFQHLRQKGITSATPAGLIPKNNAAPIEIGILGPLQVIRNGQLVSESAWSSEKAKILLAYLLWKSPMGASREELVQILWPDRPIEETANVFHVTLHRLRRVLKPEWVGSEVEYVQHDRGRYRFNLKTPHTLDVIQFEELIAYSQLESLKAAVELYRGAYMEDVVWALPPDVEARQRRLEQLYVDTLRRLAAQTDTTIEAEIFLEKLLLVEPADETAHQALVLKYLARGRRDLAQRQVARWQKALKEFNLDPLPEFQSFWHSVGC
jgi:DNA-binding SARP family transcriptional activator